MTTATKSRNGKSRNGGAPPDQPPEAEIQIDRIGRETIHVPIIGVTPLIVHRFSEKEKRKMLDNARGRKSPKEAKDPQAEYEAAFYRLADGSCCMPSLAFKKATVGAARFYGKSVTMEGLKQQVFISGEPGDDGRAMTRIEGEPEMREDAVRVGQGGGDLRYRPMFREWSAVLEVTYVTSMLTRDSILSIVDAGGSVGVGEWRPERNGDSGLYRIDPDKKVEAVR
jgi:hypothetical protein